MTYLHFIGTAKDHLARVERELAEARKAHKPTAHLIKRRIKLKARCAALGCD